MISKKELKALERFQKYPKFFFKEVLGVECEIYQAEALQMIADCERVAISACHDVGKSWLLARVVLWFVTCFPYSKVITTAPTFNQVKNILWAEIRSAYSRALFPLGGKMNLTEWQVTSDGEWFALGFTPRNELSGESGQGKSSSFQGFHAPHVLLVFDEATGVPKAIWDMAEGILTSGNIKFVAIGNPTSRLAEFYRCFSDPSWSKLKLSCFNSPNLIENGITDLKSLVREIDAIKEMSDADAQARMRSYKIVKSYLITLKWVVAMALKWGIDHPLFVSKVLGEFPKDADNALIPLGAVEEARLRIYSPIESDRKTMGVDLARQGADSTVLTMLHGKKYIGKKTMIKKESDEVLGEIIPNQRVWAIRHHRRG
jgi:phage terminase large subunit